MEPTIGKVNLNVKGVGLYSATPQGDAVKLAPAWDDYLWVPLSSPFGD